MDLPTDSTLYQHAATARLAPIVVMQMANLFACRSRDRSAFALKGAANFFIPVGLAARALGALLLLLAEEARKAVVRLRRARTRHRP